VAVPQDIKGWVTTVWAFVAIYVLIGAAQFAVQRGVFGTIIFIIAVLFAAGGYLATQGNYSAAKILLIVGGILGIPLGIVMIIAGVKIGQATKPSEPGKFGLTG
jgi:hypothetical protein